MDSQSISSSLPTLTCYGDSLDKLIEVLPFSAHLFDLKTKRHLTCNQYQAYNNGMESAEKMWGLTSDELWANWKKRVSTFRSGANFSVEKERDASLRMRHQVIQTENVVTRKEEVLLPGDGTIYIANQVRTPVFDQHKQIVAICTFSEDITRKTDPSYLYHLYKQNYPKQEAVRRFLNYFEVGNWFIKTPTDTETLTLLALRCNPAYKFASSLLHVNHRTIEVHARNLASKLSKGKKLHELLMFLRNVGHKF